MPRPGRPTHNLPDAIRAYETKGLGYEEAANAFNVPRRALRAALIERGTLRTQAESNRLGIERGQRTRKSKFCRLPIVKIADAYVRGTSEAALARKYDVSRALIARALRVNGTPRRTIKQANQIMMAARSPEQHIENARAAHRASRLKVYTWDDSVRAAQARHGVPTNNASELLYAAWLKARGIDVTHQHAIGPYNVDLATGTVAVEIFGGNWHGWGRHATTVQERTRYILDQGWTMVFVWVTRSGRRLSEDSADEVARIIQLARRDPSMKGQYRMLWCDGQRVPTTSDDLDQLTRVPAREGGQNAG